MYTNERYRTDPLIKEAIENNLKNNPGFVRLPEYPKHAVNKDGKVLSLITGKIVGAGKGSSGYLQRPMYREPDGKAFTTRIHILVARAFVENPNPTVNTIVNHKNGLKTDNRADNLEWVTYKENADYALEAGLNKTTAVILYDCENKIGYKVASLMRADVVMGNPFSTLVNKMVKPNLSQVRIKNWICAKDIGQTNIVGPDNARIPCNNFRFISSIDKIFAYNIHTKELTLYDTLSQCGKELNIGFTSIVASCSRKKPWPTFGYLFNWAEDVKQKKIEYRDFSPEELKAFGFNVGNITNPVLMTNTETGEKKVYSSSKDISVEYADLTRHYLRQYLISGDLYKGVYKIEYMQ